MGRGKLTPQDKKDMKIISANLQGLLDEYEITQSHLATLLKIPKSSLNEYVKGKSLPKAGNVQKLADYFGLKKSDIDPRFSTKTTSFAVEKISNISRQLESKRQKKVLAFCQQQLADQKETAAVKNKPSDNAKADYQKAVETFIAKELEDQNRIDLNNIKKVKDLYQALGHKYEDVILYGEVSAGTGVWVGHEKAETIQYPAPIPEHDIALRVNGNSMEPLFYDGDLIFVKKTKRFITGKLSSLL